MSENKASFLARISNYPVLTVFILFLIGLTVIFINNYQLSQKIIKNSSEQFSDEFLTITAIVGKVYASEVVKRAKKGGILASHEYKKHPGAIPVPATFNLLLSEEISKAKTGVKSYLYSDYPFTHRGKATHKDTFQRNALTNLQKTPTEPYYSYEQINGVNYLRYAKAVIMKETCVTCHNSHPQSPKTDWEVGQVRGVREVNVPLQSSAKIIETGLWTNASIMILVTLLLLSFIWIAIRQLRKSLLEVKQTNKELEEKKRELDITNIALERFVPYGFLGHIGKHNITEVELGDNIEKELTVLFSDIRSFTNISESLSPKDNFNFINDYLGLVSPIVRKHNGFIDKFIGDAVMALFITPDDAIAASIEMLNELKKFNLIKRDYKTPPIEIGIGLNTGKMMLGTIGEINRMDGTVISDAVNLASRLQDLTKKYKTPVLISEATHNNLSDSRKSNLSLVDTVTVRGKTKPVDIYGYSTKQ